MVLMGQINQSLSDTRILLTGGIRFPYTMPAGTSGPTLWAPHELPLKHVSFLEGTFRKMMPLPLQIPGDYIFRSTIKKHRYTVPTGLPCTQHLITLCYSPEKHPDGIPPGTSFSDNQPAPVVTQGSCQENNREIAPDSGRDQE